MGWDKNTRLTVHRVQNAGRQRNGDYRRSLERQHKASKSRFTTARTAFPLHFNLLFESQEEDFVSAALLTPGISSAVPIPAQHRPVPPCHHDSPRPQQGAAPGPGRTPPQVDAGARRGGGAGAGVRPLRSHAPAARSGRTPAPRSGARRGWSPGYRRWR